MGETPPLPLPEQPELRELAEALEEAGVAAEILDHKWRFVYTTSEDALGLGLDPAEMHHHCGLSLVTLVSTTWLQRTRVWDQGAQVNTSWSPVCRLLASRIRVCGASDSGV